MRLLITAALFLAVCIPAQAAQHHRSSHHRYSAHSQHYHSGTRQRRSHARIKHLRHGRARVAAGGGIVTVSTAAGPITVASHLSGRFQALIADFVAHGYKPGRVGCFAHGGHVAHSRHYAGAACDFDQRGWGKTVNFMYHAHAIIVRHGFRDGCSFNDCGHVDDGANVHYAQRRHNKVHFARHRYNEDSDG